MIGSERPKAAPTYNLFGSAVSVLHKPGAPTKGQQIVREHVAR